VQGILSFSEIAPELFELRLATSPIAQEGSNFSVRVQAISPNSKRGVPDITVSSELRLEGDPQDLNLSAQGNTDANGYVVLNFPIPPRFPRFPHELRPAGGEIKVTGQRGAFRIETTEEVIVDQFARVLLTTDKPIYQPGQTLHARALVFSPSKKVLANQPVNLKIFDNNDTVVH